MLNYFQKNHLIILGLIVSFLGVLLPLLVQKSDLKELTIVPFRDAQLTDYWLPTDKVKLIIETKQALIDQVDVKYFLIINSSNRPIQSEDFTAPLNISSSDQSNIVTVTSCSKEFEATCKPDSISYPQTKWIKTKSGWDMEPVLINPKENLCVIVITKKNTEDLIKFSGRLNNGKITKYDDAKDYIAKEKALLWYLYNHMNLAKIICNFSALILFIIFSSLLCKAGYIPTLDFDHIAWLAMIGVTCFAISEAFQHLYFEESFHIHDYIPFILGALFLAVCLRKILKK